ncbi:MAG: hypothetical protein NWQ37_11680, partial [Marivita lacus]|nr:hypothetical protein [Marivita lacus]
MRLPKVELHLHHEGAAPPGFIRGLAKEKSVNLSGVFKADGSYAFRDFVHFLSVYEAVFNLAYIVGPGIGGLLIATLGGIDTMWVTAAAFVLSIAAIAVLRLEGAG